MRVILLGIAILLLPRTGLAQEPADSVLLSFNWTVGTSALVEQEWSRMQQSSTRSDTVMLRSRYRLSVDEHPQGRLVRADSFALVPLGGEYGHEGEELLAGLGSLIPSYVVSPDGEFVDLADPAGFKTVMDSLFAPLIQQLDGVPEQAQALLERVTSHEALFASAAQSWNLMVGTWVDAHWEVGALYEYSGEEPIPLLPGSVVMMNYEFAAVERTPCNEGGDELDCVLLLMRSAPDSASFENLLAELLGTVAPGQEGLADALAGAYVINEVHVVTRPESLQPHWVEVVRYVEVPPTPGDDAGTIRVDRRAFSYTYSMQ